MVFNPSTKFGDNREKAHLFSSRTQKLSFSSPKILGWQRPGKIGHRQITKEISLIMRIFFFIKYLKTIDMVVLILILFNF